MTALDFCRLHLRQASSFRKAWAGLISQQHRLCDPAFQSEALGFALNIMRSVRGAIEGILERLDREGYVFTSETGVFKRPECGISDIIDQFRSIGIHIPISLHAWLLEVGSLNLTGKHPYWQGLDEAAGDGLVEVYTDPLVLELPGEYLLYLHEEWTSLAGEEGQDAPFFVDVSPDYLHKAGVSGGLPYQMATKFAVADSILLNEIHATSLFNYIDVAIAWQGFPGLDFISEVDRKGWSRLDM